jgi:hypothetical protein
MELQAAIEGLRAVPATSPVTLSSDSEYLIKGMSEWIGGWKRQNWKTSANKAVGNRDLWETLDALAGSRVTWNPVGGHASHPDSERARTLAQRKAREATSSTATAGETPAAPLAATPGEGAVAPEHPRSRLFARGVLEQVRSYLEGAGFRRQHDNGKHVALHLVRGSAHVIAYTNGRLQAQGSWTILDVQTWGKLAGEEDVWIRATVDAARECPMPSPFCWSPEICRYLFTQLSAGSLCGWSAELVGRHLLVREVETGNPAGILSPSAWRQLVPEYSDAIARSLHDCRWNERGRACVATSQAHNNLAVVSIRLSRVACSLASLWDWEAVGEAEPDEQHRITGQLRPLLDCAGERLSETEWREAAVGVGNQVDVLIELVRRTLRAGRMRVPTPSARPVEVIAKWPGSEECAARLLEQRSAGELRSRSPLLAEENDGWKMAGFLVKSSRELSHGT